MKFKDRVAVVTGSGQGLGRAMTERLAEEGLQVVVTDTNGDGVDEVVEVLRKKGRRAVGIVCDVTDREDVRRLGERVFADFGRLDILVNNAGITRDASFRKMSDDQWDSVLAVDLKSVFIVTQELFGYMERNGHGRIINIGSIVGASGNFGQANYTAAKAGIVGLTKTLAIELGRKGITVNAIAPGFMNTAMTRTIPEDRKAQILSSIPVGRPGEPDEVAAAVAFLASEEAGFISGVTLHVNGGSYMH